MKIGRLPIHFPGRPQGNSPGEARNGIPGDVIDLGTLPEHAARLKPIADQVQAMNVAPPVLERPVLMVHGLAQHADTWVNMKSFLASRPENPWGGVFHTDRELEFTEQLKDKPDSKVFALDVSDNLAHPRVVANDVRRAIDAILKGTGASDVYVVTHSMGTLVTREAIRQGEGKISKLCMISPPNHGSYEASLASGLHDVEIYKHYPPEKMGAMDALRLEYGARGQVTNEWLHELNEHWDADQNRPESLVITGIGLPTPDLSLPVGTAQGDGMVAARRAPLDGAGFLLAVPEKYEPGSPHFRDFQDFRYNHLQIVSEPEIFQAVGEFLGGSSQSAAATAPAPASDFERHLSRVQDQNRDLRQNVAAGDQELRWAQAYTRNATIVALAGVGAGLAGVALRSVWPIAAAGLVVAGGAAAAGGAIAAGRQFKRVQRLAGEALSSAETSMNSSDDLVHRFRRLEEPPARPPA